MKKKKKKSEDYKPFLIVIPNLYKVAKEMLGKYYNLEERLLEGLFTECCRADFNPFAYEKGEGIWQERCLNCGKLCEPIWFKKGERAKGVANPLM